MTRQERELWEKAGTIRFCVSGERARSLLERVEHKKFETALGQHWQVDRGGNVPVQSICWLFRWALNGINSPRTAEHCRTIFNTIFSKEGDAYTWFERNIGHEFALKFRYYKPRELEL